MQYSFRNIFQDLRVALQRQYEPEEATAIAEWVVQELSGYSPSALLLHGADLLTEDQTCRYDAYKRQLLAGRPLQYVLGYCFFSGLRLRVTEAVLIPRPETEELVRWCSRSIVQQAGTMDYRQPVIMDIGTGSGCIALALKKRHLGSEVYAADISAAALAIATDNAAMHQLSINFVKRDVLDPAAWQQLPAFDMIVSNPPYISLEEKMDLSPVVRDHEPSAALFVTDGDPLQFYKAIATIAADKLKPGGRIFLEAHATHARRVLDYFQAKGWRGMLKQDLQGKERMLCLYR